MPTSAIGELMAGKRVYCNDFGDASLYAMLREAAGETVELVLLEADDDAERLAKIAAADAVVVGTARLTAELIAAAPTLAFVQHQGPDYHDTVAAAALAERGIPLAVTPAGTTTGVAEHAVMLILAVLRRLPYLDAELRQGRFHRTALRAVSRQLSGRTVGLVGAGRIGRAVARRLQAFDVTLLYYDPAPLPAELEAALGLTCVPFEELLDRADIVSLHLPAGARTHKLIDLTALARMKPTAHLVNTADGDLVDEFALVTALREGRLAGAALDVFDPEPPEADNPLHAMPNVVLTPHVAAGTRDAYLDTMGFVFANLARFWSGQPAQNLVDLGPPAAD